MLAFLTRNPNIAASVRSLDLMQDDWNAEATDPEMLFLIFNRLPSLRILELNEVPVGENLSDPSIKLVVDRHLDRLRINTNACLTWGFEIPPAQYILRTMSFFRSIDTLCLNGPFYMDRTLADDASTGSPPLALHAPKHLQIGDVYPLQPLVSMMQSQSLLRNVESLTIDVIVADDSEEMQALERLLTYVSPTLLHFEPPTCELSFHLVSEAEYASVLALLLDDPYLPDGQGTFLSPLHRLETLYLRIGPIYSTTNWLDAARLLQSATARTLHTVNLGVYLNLEAEGDFDQASSSITRLEGVLLALSASGSLNRVILWVSDFFCLKETFRQIVSYFDGVFPILRKKGILEVRRIG